MIFLPVMYLYEREDNRCYNLVEQTVESTFFILNPCPLLYLIVKVSSRIDPFDEYTVIHRDIIPSSTQYNNLYGHLKLNVHMHYFMS